MSHQPTSRTSIHRPSATRVWTRRQVLMAGGAGVTIAGLAACGGSTKRAVAVPRGAPFVQPRQLTSTNGRLEVTLRAEAGTIGSGSAQRFAYTYNGMSPGPTLRVRPGDQLVITLENRLDEPTNLHTHGLHVSPSGEGDNVFVRVDPGTSHTYRYEIPTDHRSSLCWYHPHHHGMVAPQVSGGLFGGIIVEDAIDEIHEIAGSTERILIVNDPRIGDTRAVLEASGMQLMQGREGDTALVNGLAEPIIPTTAGTLERWRILNASPSRYYRLALDGHSFHVLATDGGRLAEATELDEILLAPGERTEVLVTPTSAGSYALRTRGYDRGSAGMGGGGGGGMGAGTNTPGGGAQTLATLTVSGSGTAAALPATLAGSSTLEAGAAGSERTLELGMGMGGAGMGGGGMGGGGAMRSFTIDGRSFDPTRTDITVTGDRTEDWVITNTSTMDHPFHLHAWPFRVVERTSGPLDLPGWKDTVNVPAGGRVRIRIPFTDITGRTVYHCHILDHEDQGMMGIIEVR